MFTGMDINNQPKDPNAPTNTAFWSFSFYQQFFNVNTNDVLLRTAKTFIPWKLDFLQVIKPNPDL